MGSKTILKDLFQASEQIYNADKLGLFRKCIPKHTLVFELNDTSPLFIPV